MKKILASFVTILISLLAFSQGNYQSINSSLIKAQRKGYTGLSCKIAILDVGATRVGTRGVTDTWVDFYRGYDFVNNDTVVTSSSAHGNFVLSQVSSNIGIAQDATVYVLKVYDDAGVSLIDTAVVNAIQYCIDSGVHVINMSFNFVSDTVNSKIEEAISAGIVVVAAAGNSTTVTTTSFPAALPGVVAVNTISSTLQPDTYNTIAPGSPPGAHGITVACNGVDCYVVGNSGVLVTSNGTSFSSPWFAGFFALYKQEFPTMTNVDLLQYILNKCIKQESTTDFGAGIPTF